MIWIIVSVSSILYLIPIFFLIINYEYWIKREDVGFVVKFSMVPCVNYLMFDFIESLKEELEEKERLERLLSNEMKSSKFLVKFVTNDKPDEIKFTGTFDPMIKYDYVLTSEEVAYEVLEECLEDGYFCDINKVAYPVCNITKAWVEKE